MGDSWIITNLENAFNTWNEKLIEIWQLLSETPQDFKGGGIWNLVVDINGGLKAIGYGLLVVFFAMSVFRSTMDFRDFKRPEQAFKHFIRFVGAKAAISYGLDLMLMIFSICAGVISNIAGQMHNITQTITMPQQMKDTINSVGFLESIPLWLVTLLGSLFITVLSFVLIMTVYNRFFRLYIFTALAPLPLASFAGEGTSSHGKAFIKSYVGVCIEGAVIVLACLIFSAFTSSGQPGITDPTASPVTMAWSYVAEVIFNMLVLVGLVKGADRIVKEMFAL